MAPSRAFAALWLALLALHAVATGFFGGSALFYYQLEGTYLDRSLQWLKVFSVDRKWYLAIAVLHGLVALANAAVLLKMLGVSIYHRSLSYRFRTREKESSIGPTTTAISVVPFGSPTPLDGLRCTEAEQPPARAKWWRCRLCSAASLKGGYAYLFNRQGVFGVDGRHFHQILFLRELVELTLQTLQAYRMSYYLPRMVLNRSYVGLLVANCWVTPLIYSVFERNEATKRLLCLVCDCALDFTTSVLIPCTILATYVGQYDWRLRGFDSAMWYDDVWFAHVKSEFQILLVVSWQDILMRLVFAMGMLSAMSGIKDLVDIHRPALVATSSIQPVSEPYGGYAAKAAHGALFLWGAIILGLHVSAELFPSLPQCLLQVRPWGKTSPACALIVANCYALGISGSRSELDASWSALDHESVVRLLIRHCAAFEMPPVLQKFSQITSLKVYNSTVVAWEDDAALRAAHHPHLEALFFARVNLTNGELPPGLLAPDFPPSVFNVQFCVSNLRALPADLETKWPKNMMLYLEHSAFTEVPSALVRMLPRYLSFYGTPIREVPGEVFALDPLLFLNIGRTEITSLPATVPAVSTTLLYVEMPMTGVAFFPQWFDGFVANWIDGGGELCLPGTPYCEQLNGISNGSRVAFEVRREDASSVSPPSVLMDASAENLPSILAITRCAPDFDFGFFELAFEDAMSVLEG